MGGMVNETGDVAIEASQQPLQEYVQSAGRALRVDAVRGVLRGVKLLGLRSRNGRRYEESGLRKAIGLYEGSKVNVNHPERDPLAPRDYRDRLGIVRNVRVEAGQGLFGDLHYNPSHPLAEQLAWDAEHAPENVGLSHNVLARTRRDGAGIVVEAITRVQSVDLVADPATTAGLFEQTALDEFDPTVALQEEIASLKRQLEEAIAQTERETRLRKLEQGLRESGVAAVSEASLRELVAAPAEDVDTLIEREVSEARRLMEARKPRSREQAGLSNARTCADVGAFVEAITRRR
ncbi:hypothetical protein K2D_43490 [Planctomycetes bacterium K2D]|uniref:Uncharacterized protein n=2 Tax=Botrimarina mediterranea TaxID=2528022 RepID=A0A518KEA2_9BACT|nr:hypothetical protein Spa11_43460 [Botrimarina mediterranea]QDV80719.1 hypothetical protein K2D_43490 [Planctomycetes bacterium K2D]